MIFNLFSQSTWLSREAITTLESITQLCVSLSFSVKLSLWRQNCSRGLRFNVRFMTPCDWPERALQTKLSRATIGRPFRCAYVHIFMSSGLDSVRLSQSSEMLELQVTLLICFTNTVELKKGKKLSSCFFVIVLFRYCWSYCFVLSRSVQST